MIHEIARQLPNKSIPDAIICNVGGGGLLGGALQGVSKLKWDQSKLFVSSGCASIHPKLKAKLTAIETHGANCYHLSLLANSPDPAARLLIPDR